MPFRFSLASVLQFRETMERAEEATLQQIFHAIHSVQTQIRQVEENQKTLRAQREHGLRDRLPAVHLQEWEAQEFKLKTAAAALHEQLRQLEISRQKQLVIFQNARRDRELLSRIREQRYQVYQREEARREQKTVDDLFLMQLVKDKK